MLLVWFCMSETLTTNLAGESSLPGVGTHMVLQVRGLQIFLATNLTLVRLVAVVRLLVSLEVALVLVLLLTNLARIQLLVRMNL